MEQTSNAPKAHSGSYSNAGTVERPLDGGASFGIGDLLLSEHDNNASNENTMLQSKALPPNQVYISRVNPHKASFNKEKWQRLKAQNQNIQFVQEPKLLPEMFISANPAQTLQMKMLQIPKLRSRSNAVTTLAKHPSLRSRFQVAMPQENILSQINDANFGSATARKLMPYLTEFKQNMNKSQKINDQNTRSRNAGIRGIQTDGGSAVMNSIISDGQQFHLRTGHGADTAWQSTMLRVERTPPEGLSATDQADLGSQPLHAGDPSANLKQFASQLSMQNSLVNHSVLTMSKEDSQLRSSQNLGKKNMSILSHAGRLPSKQRAQYFPGQAKRGGIAAKTAEMVTEKLRHEYIIDLKRGASANKQRTIDRSDTFFALDQAKSSESVQDNSPLFRNASDATALTPIEYYNVIPQGVQKNEDDAQKTIQIVPIQYNHVRQHISNSQQTTIHDKSEHGNEAVQFSTHDPYSSKIIVKSYRQKMREAGKSQQTTGFRTNKDLTNYDAQTSTATPTAIQLQHGQTEMNNKYSSLNPISMASTTAIGAKKALRMHNIEKNITPLTQKLPIYQQYNASTSLGAPKERMVEAGPREAGQKMTGRSQTSHNPVRKYVGLKASLSLQQNLRRNEQPSRPLIPHRSQHLMRDWQSRNKPAIYATSMSQESIENSLGEVIQGPAHESESNRTRNQHRQPTEGTTIISSRNMLEHIKYRKKQKNSSMSPKTRDSPSMQTSRRIQLKQPQLSVKQADFMKYAHEQRIKESEFNEKRIASLAAKVTAGTNVKLAPDSVLAAMKRRVIMRNRKNAEQKLPPKKIKKAIRSSSRNPTNIPIDISNITISAMDNAQKSSAESMEGGTPRDSSPRKTARISPVKVMEEMRKTGQSFESQGKLFAAFDVRVENDEEQAEKEVIMVESQRDVVWGRLKVQHRIRPFLINLQKQPSYLLKDDARAPVKEEEHAMKKVIMTWSHVPPIVLPPEQLTSYADGFTDLEKELPLPRLEFLNDAPTQEIILDNYTAKSVFQKIKIDIPTDEQFEQAIISKKDLGKRLKMQGMKTDSGRNSKPQSRGTAYRRSSIAGDQFHPYQISSHDGKYIYFQICIKNWANPNQTSGSVFSQNLVHFPVKLVFKYGVGNLKKNLNDSTEDEMNVVEGEFGNENEDQLPTQMSNDQSIDLSVEENNNMVAKLEIQRNKSHESKSDKDSQERPAAPTKSMKQMRLEKEMMEKMMFERATEEAVKKELSLKSMATLRNSVKKICDNKEWSIQVIGKRRHLLNDKMERQRALAINHVENNKQHVGQTDVKTLNQYGGKQKLVKAQQILAKRNSATNPFKIRKQLTSLNETFEEDTMSNMKRYQVRESHSNENMDRLAHQSYMSGRHKAPQGSNRAVPTSRRTPRLSRSAEKKATDEQEREQRQIEKVNTSIEKIIIKKLTAQQRQLTVKEKREQILQEEQKKKEYMLVHQQLKKKEREEHNIYLANQIIRKCRKVHWVALTQIVLVVKILDQHLKTRRRMILLKMKQSIAKMKLTIGVRQWFLRYGKVNERLVQAHNKSMVRQLPLVQLRQLMQTYFILKEKGVLSAELEKSWGDEFAKYQNLRTKQSKEHAEAELASYVEPVFPNIALKIREKLRHCFTYFGNAHGSSRVKRQQACKLMRDFLKSTAEYWGREQRFDHYVEIILKIQARLRKTMSARHAQWELLEEHFHKERKNIHNYLKLNKKKMKDADFVDSLVRKMSDIPYLSVRETLSDYMDACRERLRSVQKEISVRRQRGVAFQCFMLLDAISDGTFETVDSGDTGPDLMRKSTVDFKKENSAEGNWYDKLCPLRILAFEDIDRQEDFGMQKKHWTKVKHIIDKLNPEYKKRVKVMRMNIDDWRKEEKWNELQFKYQFKFLPIEPLMHILIIRAALQPR